MSGPTIAHSVAPDLARLNLPVATEGAIDCSSPAEIAKIRGVVVEFDRIAKELRSVPLEIRFSDWIRERLPERGGPSSGRLDSVMLEGVLSGVAITPHPHRLFVVPELCPTRIGDPVGDPRGALKRLEPWMAPEGGVVVLFSSPVVSAEHHNRILNYALGWPHHVELYAALAEGRDSRGIAPIPNREHRFDLRWSYDSKRFADHHQREWCVHFLTAEPRGEGFAPKETPVISDVVRGVPIDEKLRGIEKLGAREVISELLAEFDEYRRGVRKEPPTVAEYSRRYDIDRAVISSALTACVSESILCELRAVWGASRRSH